MRKDSGALSPPTAKAGGTQRTKRGGTLAEIMLTELERCYPGGTTTGELANTLYGKNTFETRVKVSRTARPLRKWGYRAYGFGGIYSLCDRDPAKLVQVFARTLKSTCGWTHSAGEITAGIRAAGDSVSAATARRELKKTLVALAKAL